MQADILGGIQINCWSDTDQLRDILLCSPPSLISAQNYSLEEHGFNELPSYQRLHDNYLELYKVLTDIGINVYNLENILSPQEEKKLEKCINRMFVRDIGCVIGNKIIAGSAALKAREEEFDIAKSALNSLFEYDLVETENVIEFGDLIIVNRNIVILNHGPRTRSESVKEILHVSRSQGFSTFLVLNIPNTFNRIHLDLMLNVINKNTFIADKSLANLNVTLYSNGKKELTDTFFNILGYIGIKVYWVKTNNCFSFNYLSINTETILISSCHCESFADIMKDNKIRVININSEELEKAGGSIRCSTLPLYRVS